VTRLETIPARLGRAQSLRETNADSGGERTTAPRERFPEGGIAIGHNAGVSVQTGSNNIDIGNIGTAAENNFIRIGTAMSHTSTFIAGIVDATVAGGMQVLVSSRRAARDRALLAARQG
jgi:hypothetical protein